ncbi:MAG TPA: ABC transporter permease [Pyrinomonadaceae bacterium]|jgi:lipopolysaccharide transport system permease protein
MDLDTSQSATALETAPPSQTKSSGAKLSNERTSSTHADSHLFVIESSESGVSLGLSDLWTYRELLYFLTWRDIKVRYKQTLMGAAWVIIQPLFSMLLFTLFFNKFAGLDSGDMPYPLFAYTGLLLWTFFSNAVINSTNSLVNNTNLITKVYFPRLFIPAAATGAGLVDFFIASVILVGLAVYYGVALSWSLLLLPFFVVLTLLQALGVGMLISALTVKYRDLRHALPFLIQFWMFASPVIYPSTIVPREWRWVLLANPLAGIIEGFRAALMGHAIDWAHVGVSGLVTLALLVLAVYIFRRAEETFADLV